MTAGGTCSGSIASVPAAMGGMQKRVQEVAPPGEKAERMVKHIKKGYAKDGKLTDKEKAIAYATAWQAHNKGVVEEGELNEEDRIIAPGKGRKLKPGLLSKENTSLLASMRPFKASGIFVSDRRGNKVCDCEDQRIAQEIAQALNAQSNERPGTAK